MATYAQAKVKTAQANAAVARARARAPPAGPLLLTVALTLGCYLVSDYLLFRSCDDEQNEVPPGFLQTYLWSSTSGWVYFTLARVMLSGVVFLIFGWTLACILGCCGFRAHPGPQQSSCNC